MGPTSRAETRVEAGGASRQAAGQTHTPEKAPAYRQARIQRQGEREDRAGEIASYLIRKRASIEHESSISVLLLAASLEAKIGHTTMRELGRMKTRFVNPK
jgi:hypothetical protein